MIIPTTQHVLEVDNIDILIITVRSYIYYFCDDTVVVEFLYFFDKLSNDMLSYQ
jgi:hypothetical protein